MDKIDELYQHLQKLIGLHRQLLDHVRLEKEALVAANLKAIQDATFSKQALIESIRQVEYRRVAALEQIANLWKVEPAQLTLSALVIRIQGTMPKVAEQLRSSLNALSLLVKRVSDQNDENRILVEGFLTHVGEMKRNVLGEAAPRSDLYTQNGRRATQAGSARWISKEV